MYKCWSGNITYAATHHPPGRYDACLPTVPVLHVEASLNVAAQIACRPQERRSADSIRDRIAFVVRARRFRELQRYCLQHIGNCRASHPSWLTWSAAHPSPKDLVLMMHPLRPPTCLDLSMPSSRSAHLQWDSQQPVETCCTAKPMRTGFCLRHSSLRAWTRPCKAPPPHGLAWKPFLRLFMRLLLLQAPAPWRQRIHRCSRRRARKMMPPICV